MEKDRKYDIVVIGGGPAGMAAALEARRKGCEEILILERERELGGILNQCIHNGFGLHTFGEELTGPEYANRFAKEILEEKIPFLLETMVLDIDACIENGADFSSETYKRVSAVNKRMGIFTVLARAVVLAMGCRERPRGALNIPGFRPAGIYSAGTAQRMVNIEGVMPGREAVILGSGDIGLIMARRMTLEGAKVHAVAELMPYSGGLKRNIVQCLEDYGIPLKLSHTVVKIHGKKRLKGVTLARVDKEKKPIPGTEEYIPCDTLLLSVGLIPENELSGNLGLAMSDASQGPLVSENMETSVPGVFACGNVLHVHDLVDFVTQEACAAGRGAAQYAAEGKAGGRVIEVKAGEGVRYTVPARIHPERMEEKLTVRFRVGDVYKNCCLGVYYKKEQVLSKKRRIMTPGEMEQVVLKREELLEHPKLTEITICVEEA